MISIGEVLKIHNQLIEKFGGTKGIRDKAALESAIFRPFATFNQKDLYPNPIDKAAAVLESMLINHPFIDGNKRTGYVLMRLILLQHGFDIGTTQAKKYDFVMAVAKGEMNIDTIKSWLKKNAKKDNGSMLF